VPVSYLRLVVGFRKQATEGRAGAAERLAFVLHRS
jgi:hypothetical protein